MQLVQAVCQGALPGADTSANLMWLMGDIRSIAGIALFSWRSLKIAQDDGAGMLAQWLMQWVGW